MSLLRFIFFAAYLLAFNSQATETKLTVPMDYTLIRNVMIHQLYTGEGESARFWKEGKDCSFLDASNPQLNGENGQVKIDNTLHARIGLTMGGNCVPLVEWRGLLQTLQQPTLDATHTILSFPVTQVSAHDNNGQLNSKQIQDLINKVVQPKLATLKIDLNALRGDIVKTLLPFVDANDAEKLYDTLNSLRFDKAQANDKGLLITIGFTYIQPKKSDSAGQAVFNAEELQKWQTVWSKLEQNLENSLRKPPLNQQSASELETLKEVLQEAGAAFTEGLTSPDIADHDPVREYLNNSWDKLAPLLRDASKQLTGTEGLRYLTLISATDLLYELETVTTPLGLEVSANGLRKLARAYLAHLATST
ncbi:hypothetical protein [Methylomonas sp. AM2-LC]|uniref:hypothetical protein n=1 Tax=Methylomonas sp. AM2-LC TaxID=3153301 RepID=UPI0032631AE1